MATDPTITLQDFSARAAEGYARLAAEAQQLLARIYRGELNPAVLQDQIPSLLRQRGAEYYLELSRLSYELFTGLLELGRTYREELFHELLPDAPDFRPPTRTSGSYVDDWTQWYQAFNAKVVEEHTQTITLYQVILRKISAGELKAEQLQENLRRFVEQRAPVYARRSAELNSTFFEGLIGLNERSLRDLFTQLMPVDNSREATVETLSLTLVGATGTSVSGSLTVENLESHRSRVSCSISPFRSTDGSGPSFEAACEADPGEFLLEPNETRAITVRLFLNPDTFVIGRKYASTMVIRGMGEEDVLVFIIAAATES